jgi:hypothetical protein
MHHPTICSLLSLVDDYFLLIDGNDSTCHLKPIIDNTEGNNLNVGIKISRKLLNGYLHTLIAGDGRDSDKVIFSYSSDINTSECLESIEIECSDYSTDRARDAIRDILKLDKNVSKQQSSCH